MYVTGILLIAVLAAFVSCKDDVSLNGGLSTLNLTLIADMRTKALVTDGMYNTGMTVASYQYKATCISKPGAQGTQSSWATLDVNGNTTPDNLTGGQTASATLQRLARGTWEIDVRALNSTGGVILQGKASCLLKTAGQDLSITLNTNIQAYADEDPMEVTVSVGVTVLTIPEGSISVKFVPLKNVGILMADGSTGTPVSMQSYENRMTEFDGSGIKYSSILQDYTAYCGSVDLLPGLYAMQILYKDGTDNIAGQMIAFRVNEKAPFAINGTLEDGEYLNLNLTPIYETSRTITLNWAANGTPAVNESDQIVAQVVASAVEGELGECTYFWSINGIFDDNAETAANIAQGKYISTGTYNPGSYSVSCFVSATINGVDSVGYLNYNLTVE